MTLQRRGDNVTGSYNFGLGFGAIKDGRVVDKRLYFGWEWAGNYGQSVLGGRDDGSFTGTWGYRESRSGAGTWAGRRSSESE